MFCAAFLLCRRAGRSGFVLRIGGDGRIRTGEIEVLQTSASVPTRRLHERWRLSRARDCAITQQRLLCFAVCRAMPGKVGGALAAPIWERFWNKVERGEHHWLWTGAHNDSGYGVIYDGRRNVYAHRLSWLLHGFTIPDGLTIDHMCFNKLCVNPAHLEPVERLVNVKRAAVRRREVWGYTITDETRAKMRESQRRRRNREKAA